MVARGSEYSCYIVSECEVEKEQGWEWEQSHSTNPAAFPSETPRQHTPKTDMKDFP